MFIDSHCHLSFPELSAQLPELLGAMSAAQVERSSRNCSQGNSPPRAGSDLRKEPSARKPDFSSTRREAGLMTRVSASIAGRSISENRLSIRPCTASVA